MRCLVWLAANQRSEYEAYLLELEPLVEARHLRALRRAVDVDVLNERARQRKLQMHEAVTQFASPEELIARALQALATYVRKNMDRMWRPADGRRGYDESGKWIGRWDDPDEPISLDAEVVRTVVAAFGEPRKLLAIFDQRGLLQAAPGGGLRWQRRIGRRRQSCIAFLPAGLPGLTGDDCADDDGRP